MPCQARSDSYSLLSEVRTSYAAFCGIDSMKTNLLAHNDPGSPAIKFLLATLIVTGSLLNPTSASSARVSIAITATVTEVDDFNQILNGAIQIGDTIRGF